MAAEALDGEGLRAAVIGASGDARVRAMLATAEVTAAATAAYWEASHGGVRGYAVTVALCAEDLATLDASPATRDLLESGFAVAVGATPDRAMVALTTRWNRRGVAHGGTYREVARTAVEVTLAEALRRYGATRGDGCVVPAGLHIDEAGEVLDVSTRAPVDRRVRPSIKAALAAMLGPQLTVRWSVR